MHNDLEADGEQVNISGFGERLKERLTSLINSTSGSARSPLAPFLAQVFGVSRTHGYRLLDNFDHSVTLDRLEQLCKHFGVKPDALLLEDEKHSMLVTASVEIAGLELFCIATIDQMPAANHSGLVAWRTGNGWQVGAGKEGAHPVLDLRVNTKQSSRLIKVAVLDDDYQAAETWADVLVDNGYDADAYGSARLFLEAINKGSHFDALILDWKLGTTTGDEVIKELKDKGACPEHVIILSGVQTDYTKQITEAIKSVKAYPMVKPVQKDILLATLKTKIGEM